jgi:membrane protein
MNASGEPGWWAGLWRRPVTLATTLRRTALAAMQHDALTVAQATAYSAIVALFPGLIVAAAVVGLLPEWLPLRSPLAMFFDRVLPPNVSPILESYFAVGTAAVHKSPQTARALVSAAVVSLVGAASVMATLMEGFRRAHHLPLPRRSFWPRRRRALELVPLSLLPMTAASALVVFGHVLTLWMASKFGTGMRVPVYVLALGVRWSIALAGSVGIIAVIYHLGTDVTTQLSEHLTPPDIEPLLRQPMQILRKQWSWKASLPGATLATLLWFVTTLVFGLYVTRFANYSRVYGSLGAAIALLFWLYIIALCVLIGAEFNAQLVSQRQARERAEEKLEGDAAVMQVE